MTSQENTVEYIIQLEKKINQSTKGLQISFDSLTEMSLKFFQEIHMIVIASKNKEILRRYEEDQEMYEACDFVFEMIDGGFWEVFSQNMKWIDQLAKKSQKVEFLTTDFQK